MAENPFNPDSNVFVEVLLIILLLLVAGSYFSSSISGYEYNDIVQAVWGGTLAICATVIATRSRSNK